MSACTGFTPQQAPRVRWAGGALALASSATPRDSGVLRPNTPGVEPSEPPSSARAPVLAARAPPSTVVPVPLSGTVALSQLPLSEGLWPSVALDGWVPPPRPMQLRLGIGVPSGAKPPEKRRLRVPTKGWASEQERERECERVAVEELVRVLPEPAIAHAVGGLRSWMQVGSSDELRDMAIELFSSKPGTEASNIKAVIGVVHLMWAFAAQRGLADAGFTPEASVGLVASIIRGEHVRATQAAVGAQDGHTVGDRTRRTFYYMYDRLRLPVDTGPVKARHPLIEAAAPPPTVRAPKHVCVCAPRRCHCDVIRCAVLDALAGEPRETIGPSDESRGSSRGSATRRRKRPRASHHAAPGGSGAGADWASSL